MVVHRIIPKDGSEQVIEEKDNKGRTLTISNCNPYIKTFKAMEYAARGPVIMRAMQIDQELREGIEKPFTEVVKANLGDAHAMGQKPITFLRQVLALVACPTLIDTCQFNEDVKMRAKSILNQCRGESAGAYTDSRGLEIVRKSVAKYIEKRDGVGQCSHDDVIICAGASEGIRSCLKLFKSIENAPKKSGVMVPVPEYPLYSATLGEYNIHKINYFLDESKNWGVSSTELDRALGESQNFCEARAIVVINPGNPTGQVLSRNNIEEIIKFAYRNEIFILADEVYQDNVYGNAEFLSFKKVLTQMPFPFNQVELISFYSCSKGYVCECGLRGGYFEMTNMDPEVKSLLSATAASKLCPTVLGQAAVYCSVNPPQPGDESYQLFIQEKDNILNSFADKAILVTNEFNSIPRITCSVIQGAMYAYPKIEIPPKAILAAKLLGQEPDVFYALDLLESTGICVVPGSGVGQQKETYHFRTTILPNTSQVRDMLKKFRMFHCQFLEKYA